jgi:serine/threonine-protein kinase
MARLTAVLADRYRVERELGAGGMATVYLARDLKHERLVALKVLRPELGALLGVERFLSEIRVTAGLQHPHILPLFDSGQAERLIYYVMPHVEGETLRQRLDREKQLPIEEAVDITRAVASALDYAHRHGVIHRDIKPENILFQDGQAVVADFGIALALSAAGGSRLTETGLSLGTPSYMSPEQATGERVIDARTDIYSLGAVLYEMLTGGPPHTGPTVQAVIAQVVADRPRRITLARDTVPPHVEAAVLKALEKVPADRFQSAAEFAEALVRPGTVPLATPLVSGQAPAAPVPARRLVARARVLRAVAVSVVLLLAGLAGAAALALLRPQQPAPPVGRFQVPVGRVELGGYNTPVVSADGARIVFPAQDSQRVLRMFLRSLDREQPVLVPGAEGTDNTAFFSPDGQWIGFDQGGKLRKTAITGGAVAVICDKPGDRAEFWWHASWGPDDVIVFAVQQGLYRVATAGGQPQLVVAADSAAGALGFASPHFLPDGRKVLATRLTMTGTDLVAVSLRDGRIAPLGISGMTPYYVDGGWLVYADASGTAFAARFDPGRARVASAPVPLVENVLIAGVLARLSVARTGTIAYYTGGVSATREIVLADREGRVQVLPVPPGAYRYPRFSPDGRRLAVGVQGSLDLWGDISVYDFGSRRLAKLTYDTSSAHPEWTPDGRRLVYARRQAPGPVRLFRLAADGSTDPEPFFARPGSIFESHLTPDGRTLVYRENTPGGSLDILVAPSDSPAASRPLAATGFAERSLALSPDGRWLAFTSNLTGTAEVYVRRLVEGSPRWRVSTGGGTEPRWGPGGRELFYRNTDSLYVVPVTLGVEVQLGEPRALFGGRFMTSPNEPLYDVSPDGRQFAMVRDVGGGRGVTLHVILNWFDQPRARRR